MNQPPTIRVEILKNYSSQDAAMIGKILPDISERFSSKPVAEQLLRNIIDSPSHDQLVARGATGQIVGLATLSVTMGVGAGRNAWLDDLVVSKQARETGIGAMLWNEIINWCRQKNVNKLGFTSKPSRQAAHRFYQAHGAELRDTNYFRKLID